MGGQRVRRCTIGATVSHPLNRTKRIFMRFAFALKSALIALTLATPLTATAAGKCDRLVATGAADNPPFLWRIRRTPNG